MTWPIRSRGVVVLDRDGTLVVDRGYLGDPDGLELLPGAAVGLRQLADAGFRLLVITNQSGVGRGFFGMDAVVRMNLRLNAMVESAGAKLEHIYVCPHAPEDQCLCRKPALGLMRRAARELDFDPALSFVVGDKASDVEFGRRAGATTLLVGSPSEMPQSPSSHFIVSDLPQAAKVICQQDLPSQTD